MTSHETAIWEFMGLGLMSRSRSALHGKGTGDLLDALITTFLREGLSSRNRQHDPELFVLLVGRPNVGSPLLNRLIEERAVVHDRPARLAMQSTRSWRWTGPIRFVDTRVRRKAKIDEDTEATTRVARRPSTV